MRHFENDQKAWELDGPELKQLLLERGPNLKAAMEELANEINMSPSTIKNWLKTKNPPNPYNSQIISDVAVFLGVGVEKILKKTDEKEKEWKELKRSYGSGVIISFFLADLLRKLWGIPCNLFDIKHTLTSEYDSSSQAIWGIIELNSIYKQYIDQKKIKSSATKISKKEIRKIRRQVRFSGLYPSYIFYTLNKSLKCDISFFDFFCCFYGNNANKAFYDLFVFLCTQVQKSEVQRYCDNGFGVCFGFSKYDRNKPLLYIPNPMQGLWGRLYELLTVYIYERTTGRKVDYSLFSLSGNCSVWNIAIKIKQKIKYEQISALIIYRDSIERNEWLVTLINSTIDKCGIEVREA